MSQKEYLDVPFELETKDVDGETGSFKGYGSTFNGAPDPYGDVVLPGAFSKSIASGGRNGTGVALLWQHMTDAPVGTWTSLGEDKKGLAVEGQLVKGVKQADEGLLLMKAGAIKGLSIGYTVPKNGSEFDKDKGIRYLKEVTLWEISLVTFPANTKAQITRVKALENSTTAREFEAALRDAGLSLREAKLVVYRARTFLKDQRDSKAMNDMLSALRAENTRMEIRNILEQR